MEKILIITQNYDPELGSASNRMNNISNILSKKFVVNVLTTRPMYPDKNLYTDRKDITKNDNILFRVHIKKYVHNKNFFNRFMFSFRILLKMIRKIHHTNEQYSVIYATSPPLIIMVVGLYAKYKYKAKLIIDIRDLWPESLKLINNKVIDIIRNILYVIEKICLKQANEVIVNSEGFYSYVKRLNENVSFIPNALTSEELSITEHKKDSINIFFVGNIGYAQNIEPFLYLADFFKVYNNVKFSIIGYGIDYESVKRRNLENDLQINIMEPMPRAEVFDLLKTADVAYVGMKSSSVLKTVLPGRLIDFMGAALPIIAVVDGYSKKIIEKADAGIVFKEEETVEMVQLLKKWIHCPEERIKYGENGRVYAAEYFNWAINGDKLTKIVRK